MKIIKLSKVFNKVPRFTLRKIAKFIEFSIFWLISSIPIYMYLKFSYDVLTGKQDFFLFMMVNVFIGLVMFLIMALWED